MALVESSSKSGGFNATVRDGYIDQLEPHSRFRAKMKGFAATDILNYTFD